MLRKCIYTFSPSEVRECFAIGRARNSINVQHKRRNINYSGRDDAEISIQGVLGEWALCRLANRGIAELYDVTPRNAQTDTFDLTLDDGRTIDVKTVINPNNDLLVHTYKKKNPPTFYGLFYLERNVHKQFLETDTYRVHALGWVPSDRLFVEENLVNYSMGTFYRFKRDLLQKEINEM